MKSLPINLKTFDFVEREKRNGIYVRNKCGRDFLYYALHYYFPKQFNAEKTSLPALEQGFGIPMPVALAWTQLQFLRMPRFIAMQNCSLSINNIHITTFPRFVRTILMPTKQSAAQAITALQNAVDKQQAAGIDISLGFAGLLDHVMFIYGYDKRNLYVIDTHRVPGLEYEKITRDNRYLMRLPKATVKKHWSRFGRVWIIQTTHH